MTNASIMTAERAAYFMRRFKHDEKLLGPNEQAAVDYVIALLEQTQAAAHAVAQAQPVARAPIKANRDEVICPNCTHQFRAIPVNVQYLMLGAGFEPPFTHPRADAPMSPEQTEQPRAVELPEPVACLTVGTNEEGGESYEVNLSNGMFGLCAGIYPLQTESTVHQLLAAERQKVDGMLTLARRNFEMFQSLMAEAGEALGNIPPDVFEKLNIRYPLSDELSGASYIAKDSIAAIDKHREKPTCGN